MKETLHRRYFIRLGLFSLAFLPFIKTSCKADESKADAAKAEAPKAEAPKAADTAKAPAPDAAACVNPTITDAELKAKIVPVDDPQARGLAYYENLGEGFDASKYRNFQPGQLCNNCQFYRKADEKQGHAPCTMLRNRYVAGCGWCRVYQPMRG